jgi:hypothetical protein
LCRMLTGLAIDLGGVWMFFSAGTPCEEPRGYSIRPNTCCF